MLCSHGVVGLFDGEAAENSREECQGDGGAKAKADEDVAEEEGEGVPATRTSASVRAENTAGSHDGVALLIQAPKVAVEV